MVKNFTSFIKNTTDKFLSKKADKYLTKMDVFVFCNEAFFHFSTLLYIVNKR